jgi:chorismate mutase
MLNKKLQGAKIDAGTNFAIAQLILDLANKMNVTTEQITKYIMDNEPNQDPKEIQEVINKWRKNYYGSMDPKAKQKLIENLSDKLRPEVIDQIRRA